jgi:hypothetical protein
MSSKPPPDYLFYGRRLSDKLLLAFDKACEVRELETASELLQMLERLAAKEGAGSEFRRRKAIEGLVEAHERLWMLRHEAAVA